MLVLPVLYWCIDTALGLRVGVVLLAGSNINDAFKLAFHSPRPFWYSTEVKGMASETGFGIPSGHSFSAVNVWGMLASRIRKPWAWITALALILLIGISRLYLGMHFPIDVLVGWLLGILFLWLVLRWWDKTATWLKKLSLGGQVMAVFCGSLLLLLPGLLAAYWLKSSGWSLPDSWVQTSVITNPTGEAPNPTSLAGIISNSGALFGLGAGLAWLNSRGGFSTKGKWWQQILRVVVGVIGVLIVRYGLKAVFPGEENWIGLTFQYIRYAFIGAWVSAGAPLLFLALRLAKKQD